MDVIKVHKKLINIQEYHKNSLITITLHTLTQCSATNQAHDELSLISVEIEMKRI